MTGVLTELGAARARDCHELLCSVAFVFLFLFLVFITVNLKSYKLPPTLSDIPLVK